MIAVIFEVWAVEGRKDDYLDQAALLRSELLNVDGFVSVERFQSLSDPSKMLSLSFWRDEASVEAWRTNVTHRKSQVLGRNGIFANYRLRVASVLRDYGMAERRAQAPHDSRRAHDEQS